MRAIKVFRDFNLRLALGGKQHIATGCTPIPVILDTNIGVDIDDTWALATMLKSSELEAKLIVSDTRDTNYRARIIAKILEVAGRTDMPIGVSS